MNPLKLFLALSATHCVQRMQYYPSGLPWSDVMGTSEQPYKYNGKEFIEMHGLDEYDYKTDYTTILSMGYRGGNLYSAILGSFNASWSLEGFNHNGDAIVKITASNSMTPNSALRNPKTGYTQEWNQSTGKLLNVIFPNGLFGTQIMRPTEQTITWTTTIKKPSK